MKEYIISYFIFISVVAVIITVYDKKSAQKSKWRIRENTLMLFSLLGGSVAMYITMKLIHHKTRHKKFMIGIPVIMFFQAALMLIYLH